MCFLLKLNRVAHNEHECRLSERAVGFLHRQAAWTRDMGNSAPSNRCLQSEEIPVHDENNIQ